MADETPKPNYFGSPVVLGVFVLVAIGLWRAPDIIQAVNPPPTVNPIPTPVSDFPSKVRQSLTGVEQEKQNILRDDIRARMALLKSEAGFDNTEDFHDVTVTASKVLYGESRYGGEPLDPFWVTAYEEALRRGLLAPDSDNNGRPDKPIALDRGGYLQFYSEILEGLQ